jgi:hypothetical protein
MWGCGKVRRAGDLACNAAAVSERRTLTIQPPDFAVRC